MSWKVEYLPEAEKDLKGLDGSQRNLVLKAIKKVQQNPLPVDENGYGKPLGNHSSTSLAGLMKIKLRSAGLRIVYQLRRTETSMMIIVIGVRADEEVYELAQKRVRKHDNTVGHFIGFSRLLLPAQRCAAQTQPSYFPELPDARHRSGAFSPRQGSDSVP